jgi:hypothetical protein
VATGGASTGIGIVIATAVTGTAAVACEELLESDEDVVPEDVPSESPAESFASFFLPSDLADPDVALLPALALTDGGVSLDGCEAALDGGGLDESLLLGGGSGCRLSVLLDSLLDWSLERSSLGRCGAGGGGSAVTAWLLVLSAAVLLSTSDAKLSAAERLSSLAVLARWSWNDVLALAVGSNVTLNTGGLSGWVRLPWEQRPGQPRWCAKYDKYQYVAEMVGSRSGSRRRLISAWRQDLPWRLR